MNVLILSSEVAQFIVAKQEGQHRLGPVSLADGRFFLSADVLAEPRFAKHLESVEYETAAFDDVRSLMPVIDETWIYTALESEDAVPEV